MYFTVSPYIVIVITLARYAPFSNIFTMFHQHNQVKDGHNFKTLRLDPNHKNAYTMYPPWYIIPSLTYPRQNPFPQGREPAN